MEKADALYSALSSKARGNRYRLCANSIEHGVCNWLIPQGDANPLCEACRLNDVVPNLSTPDALQAWARLEQAKRRVIYTLLELDLPIESRSERPESGLSFSFMADDSTGKVFTGHSDGLITINIAEADDPFREKLRKDLKETYRTLLGHFRHEIGHYYWDRLVKDSQWLAVFRGLFGDEQLEYQKAVERHYSEGAPKDWPEHFVSAYATMHPWEDWAETWAHYLHMVDTLGTARSYGLVIRPKPIGGSAQGSVSARQVDFEDFDDLAGSWMPLTLALNSLNRSMGHTDAYPFVLTPDVVRKLRFVHDVVEFWNAPSDVTRAVIEQWNEELSRSAEESMPAPLSSTLPSAKDAVGAKPAGAPKASLTRKAGAEIRSKAKSARQARPRTDSR
jgi:hypothetical protein